EPDARRDPRSARRQPLSLHGLHEDPRCRGAGGVADGRGHWCGCGGHWCGRGDIPGARTMMNDDKHAFAVIGQPLPKIDAWAKVTGETKYADDLVLPRMAFGKLLRSSHAHARITRIDTGRARALPGVYAVITGADLPRVKFGIL